MIVQSDHAIFLTREDKSFKNQAGNKIEYTKVTFIDDQNQYIEATLSTELRDTDTPEPREECQIELEVTEENGSKGKYLKKKVISIV